MNHALSLLVPMFRWAQQRRIIRRLPITQGYELPRSAKTPTRRVPPEVDQLARYLSAALDVVPDVAPLLTLVATTGMRRGEAVVLRRADLDPVRCRLRVEHAADLDHSLKRTKTDTDRDFALDADNGHDASAARPADGRPSRRIRCPHRSRRVHLLAGPGLLGRDVSGLLHEAGSQAEREHLGIAERYTRR